MGFHPLFLIVFAIPILSASVPVSFSIENPDKGLSYTEKSCDNGSCKVTTCFEDKHCIITDSNDSPTKTTSSNDKIHQLFGDSESDLIDMEFMDVFDDFFDLN